MGGIGWIDNIKKIIFHYRGGVHYSLPDLWGRSSSAVAGVAVLESSSGLDPCRATSLAGLAPLLKGGRKSATMVVYLSIVAVTPFLQVFIFLPLELTDGVL